MMEVDKKLYKKDTKGRIRFLRIATEGAELIKESGLIDGKPVEHRSTCKAKNVGRANETTPEEQARAEAESLLVRKLDEGYFETQTEAEEEEVILPMLAKSFDKELKKVKFPCYVQPKLDGMRALGGKKLISRKGKSIDTLKHINDSISKVPEILDGELYAHGKSFQENMTIIKKYRKGKSEDVKYHVYDLVSDKPFTERFQDLLKIVENMPNVEPVDTYIATDVDDIKKYHREFLGEGYEGTIVRWGDAPYKVNGRSSNLLKYKDFIDEDYKIVDVEPSDRNPEQGIVICETTNNKGEKETFGCGMKFSHAEREEILKNKSDYIGRIGNIRFFEYTDDGLPRFPVFVGVHEDR